MSIIHGFIAILDALHRFLIRLPGFAFISSCVVFLFSSNDTSHSTERLGLQNKPPSWHKYVRSSPNSVVNPLRIIPQYTIGNVTNPNGLLGKGSPTILTRNSSSSLPPTIVVDFGQNTVGIISIAFAGSSNYSSARPGIRLAFSETLQFLSDVSDFSRSYNVRSLMEISCSLLTIKLG